MTRNSVVLTASEFNFGPTGAAVYVAEELRRRGYNVLIVGGERARELALASGMPFHGLPDTNPEVVRTLVDKLGAASCLVSAMEPRSVRVANKLGIPSVWLDPLAWWSELKYPAAVEEATLKIRVSSVEDGIRREGRQDEVWVGPLVSSDIHWEGSGHAALLNVGGVSPTDPHVCRVLTGVAAALSECEELLPPIRIIGSAEAATFLSTRLKGVHVDKAGPASQLSIPALIRDAPFVLSPPGIGFAQEAWSQSAPLFVLPPMNRSQELQLERYAQLAAVDPAPNGWHIASWYRSSLDERLSRYLQDRAERDHVARRGEAYSHRLGRDGVRDAADHVERLIRSFTRVT